MWTPGIRYAHRKGPVVAVMLAVSMTATLASAQIAGLRINATASMPVGLWRVTQFDVPLRRGEIVAVCPPDTSPIRLAVERGYIAAGQCPNGYEPLLKPIGAVSGDLVAVTASGVWVNGKLVPDTAQMDFDSVGRPLQRLTEGAYRVTPNEVWLLSNYDPRSFDSRYFGPVPAANVLGVAHPVWVLQ
jgi:conjugative transfer signal peptidase TraF